MDRGNICLRHVFLTLSEFIGDYAMNTVTITATTINMIKTSSGAVDAATAKVDAALLTLPQIAEAMYADGVRYDMLKGEKPAEDCRVLREQIKDAIAHGIKSADRRAVTLADKKTAKDFSEFQKAERKEGLTHVSKYYSRLCEAMPDAPVAEPKQAEAKTQADKLRTQLETALKIVQGEPDGSLADMLTLSKGLQDLIAATYLKQGKNL